jgi:replicative DNA helicase
MVIFIHRYDYQGLSDNPHDVGRTQIIIAKHRNGSIADIDMRFRADEVRFVDEQESLVNQADMMPVASAMNDDMPPFGPDMMGHMPPDEFGMNDEF